MRVSLINLGDGDRCLFDTKSRVVTVGVGEIVSADLSEKTVDQLRKFRKTDTLLVGPEGSISPPVKLRATLDILKVVDFEPYDRLLRKFWDVSPRIDGASRPSRLHIRRACRGIIENHLCRVSEAPVSVEDEAEDESSEDDGQAPQAQSQPVRHKSEMSARMSGRRRARR